MSSKPTSSTGVSGTKLIHGDSAHVTEDVAPSITVSTSQLVVILHRLIPIDIFHFSFQNAQGHRNNNKWLRSVESSPSCLFKVYAGEQYTSGENSLFGDRMLESCKSLEFSHDFADRAVMLLLIPLAWRPRSR